MMRALEIAIGSWLGGIFLAVTVAVVVEAHDKIQKNKKYGRAWWQVSR